MSPSLLGGSVPTPLTSGLCVCSAAESGPAADDETWRDDVAYSDRISLYATAPRSKVSIAAMTFYSPERRRWEWVLPDGFRDRISFPILPKHHENVPTNMKTDSSAFEEACQVVQVKVRRAGLVPG